MSTGKSSQQELLGNVPQAPESYPPQPHSLFQLAKQSFDLVPSVLRTLIGRRASEGAYDLPGRLLPVHEEPAIRSPSTALFLWAALAQRCGRAIGATFTLAALTDNAAVFPRDNSKRSLQARNGTALG